MKLGEALITLVDVADVVGAVTDRMRERGQDVPEELERVVTKARKYRRLAAMATQGGPSLDAMDRLFDEAVRLQGKVQIRLLAADGSELEVVDLSELAVLAADKMLDSVRPDPV